MAEPIPGARPGRTSSVFGEGLIYARTQRLPSWERVIAGDVAGLEADDGDVGEALVLFDTPSTPFTAPAAPATWARHWPSWRPLVDVAVVEHIYARDEHGTKVN